ANFTASAGSTSETVNQAATRTTVIAAPNPSVHGHAVTFTASVLPVAPGAGTPTGSVDFFDTSTQTDLGTVALDSNGQASLTTSSRGIGSHTIQASYSGDPHFAASTGNTTETVSSPTSPT